MDSFSEVSVSSNEEENLTKYTKQKHKSKIILYNQNNSLNEDVFKPNKTEKQFDIKTLDKDLESGENIDETNILKRKRQSDKIFTCEFCNKESKKYKKGQISNKFLCDACYQYEYRHGYLDKRKEPKKHKNHILACEFCQKESVYYRKGTVSGKSLCGTCYQYESRHGHLTAPDEREKHNNILVCEICQKESAKYTTGKVSGKSVCTACYTCEYRHGHERKYYEKYKNNILACEFCQRESTKYTRSKPSGKVLCIGCYKYERKYGHLIPRDERTKRGIHKDILECEVCHKESIQYRTGQVSCKSLCDACYQCEYRHDRKCKNNQSNCLLNKKKTSNKK